MSAIEDLFEEAPPSIPSCTYMTLEDAIPCEGVHGRYIKLVCVDGEGLPVQASADARYFDLLEPYIELLRQARDPESVTTNPVIPVFFGEDHKWRFSWLAAARDYPERAPALPSPGQPTPSTPADLSDTAYRLQTSVPAELAHRFKQAALARGLTHTQFLTALIRSAVT